MAESIVRTVELVLVEVDSVLVELVVDCFITQRDYERYGLEVEYQEKEERTMKQNS